MPQFSYVGVDRQGKQVKGSLEAASEGDLRMSLRVQGIRPRSISKAGSQSIASVDLFTLIGGGKGAAARGVPIKVLVLFTRQLQLLISSGIPLVQALEVLHEQSLPSMRGVVGDVRDRVLSGGYLWESLAVYPKIFPKLYVSLIRAGETSGSIDQMLKRLSKYLEDEERLKRMIRSAMMYPLVVTAVGMIVVTLMMVFVIPKFEDMLKQSNETLPVPTQFVIDISHFFQNNLMTIMGVAITGVYLLKRYFQTQDGRSIKDRILFHAPLFGELTQKSGVARFSRTLQNLLSSGVNLIDAVDICRASADNVLIESAVGRIRGEVESGKTLGMIMSKMDVFPKMAVQMVMVGESTGNLDKSLEKIADFYESDVEVMVGNMTKLLEPIILVVLGGVVGGLMIAMYLPIFKMAGATG